jgi:coronatine-insensitive protein 1
MVGQGYLHLTNCHIVLGKKVKKISELPLDDGMKLLLKGYVNLTQFCLYLRQGALIDQGLAHIGKYSRNLKWLLLSTTKESDVGLASLHMDANNWNAWKYKIVHLGKQTLLL